MKLLKAFVSTINILYLVAPVYILFIVFSFSLSPLFGVEPQLSDYVLALVATIAVILRLVALVVFIIKKYKWQPILIYGVVITDILLVIIEIFWVSHGFMNYAHPFSELMQSLIFFPYDVFGGMFISVFPGPLLITSINALHFSLNKKSRAINNAS